MTMQNQPTRSVYRTNRAKLLTADAAPVSGITVQLASPEVIEMCGAAGLDFVWIDAEHGSFDLQTAVEMFRAADAQGITPLFRVPSLDAASIMRALDGGAMGVIVPNVSSAEQARAAVSFARYRADGVPGLRGACPSTRAARYLTDDWDGFVRWSNGHTTVWALIETLAGVENIDAILAVDGLDAIALGPFDLSHELGLRGQPFHPEVTGLLDRVVERANHHRVPVVASLFAAHPDGLAAERDHWLKRGVRIFSVGSDRALLSRSLRERAAVLAAAPGHAR
ncbi:HpcH/HpaI aldolase family protein [Paraburkholderia caballeronis]|uniref:4-hydroxy-2-oxoheptanedioate aldolase n=1 Tax=Paraburkholderia caballeronis TaxID=416943 RepID=A0A1H7M4G4_9BURK|nr:aldolase/citrate lyase family protein [Paraburkholderia caballeronis]PXW28700.1 4-hydroxy-2-oxoheptanedioate aldolase [Paraburkholderia caballeronis]PXX04066.1 4-hydroxy-2-oxoheptanedioate aldolase [Paraburkholderia caballeronis]RAK04810.1 4-hydroxy-2-oxoheptanedioate aldolase [Paraburkholderia caballeronis]TDV39147.1 4-hydroxy-2-oxoheptanedioate aldolase [Paraburkholderia caballeronis]SED63720.1 4-hydroxy-2-oxoheptanedioate aldolase [Paraburkholderia caballeronis]